jgi:hypothetical protein
MLPHITTQIGTCGIMKVSSLLLGRSQSARPTGISGTFMDDRKWY